MAAFVMLSNKERQLPRRLSMRPAQAWEAFA